MAVSRALTALLVLAPGASAMGARINGLTTAGTGKQGSLAVSETEKLSAPEVRCTRRATTAVAQLRNGCCPNPALVKRETPSLACFHGGMTDRRPRPLGHELGLVGSDHTACVLASEKPAAAADPEWQPAAAKWATDSGKLPSYGGCRGGCPRSLTLSGVNKMGVAPSGHILVLPWVRGGAH